MKIIRCNIEHFADAQVLLGEYFEAIAVVKRDDPAGIADYLSDDSSSLWIAYIDEFPAGCVVLRPLLALGGEAAECKRLYVRPAFRGQGIADALLVAMEDRARANHIEWIFLDSKDDLQNALHVYKRRGYQACERYNDNPQATIFMRKRLFSAAS